MRIFKGKTGPLSPKTFRHSSDEFTSTSIQKQTSSFQTDQPRLHFNNRYGLFKNSQKFSDQGHFIEDDHLKKYLNKNLSHEQTQELRYQLSQSPDLQQRLREIKLWSEHGYL